MTAKTDTNGQLQLGKLYRDQGIERVTRHADAEYRVKVDEAILQCAREGEPFTSDKVRAIAGDPPEGQSPNIFSARFMAASKRKWIEDIGRDHSRRKEGHARKLTIWIGVLPTTPATLEATA